MAKPKKPSKVAAKTKSKPSAAAPARTDAISEPTEQTWDLEQLHLQLGEPSEEIEALMLGACTAEDFLALGVEFTSDDIVKSVPRFVGLASEQWAGLDASQRKLLRGFSPDVLALIVKQARALRELLAGSKRAGGAAARRDALRALTSEAVSLRDGVLDALGSLVPAKGPLRRDVDAGVGTAATPEELARGLDALATIVTAARKGVAAAHREKLDELGIDASLPASLNGKAAELRAASGKVDGGDAKAPLDQRQLDIQDGRVLHPLVAAYKSHRNAHALNSVIVVPALGRLRRVGATHAKSKTSTVVATGTAATDATKPS